jgi:hypothetical protein
MSAVNRFLNPVMKVMCTTSHTSHAIRPEEPQPMRAEDRAAAIHGGHAPEVPVLPRGRFGAVSHTVSDDVSSMQTGLEGNLGNAREVVVVHHVADYEDLRVAGQ